MRRQVLLLTLIPLLAWAQKPTVTPTVAASYSATLAPTSIEWAPDGKAFAFIEGGAVMIRRAGKETKLVTLADLPAKQSQGATPFAWINRNVREKPLQWIGQNALLVKERGDLFYVPFESAWKQLTSTLEDERDPKLSPDGRSIAFVLNNNLHVMPLNGGKPAQLTRDGAPTLLNGVPDWVYPEELDLGSAYWWSPDSKSLAFLQFNTSQVLLYPQADLTGLRAINEDQRYSQAGTPNSKVRLGVVKAQGGSVKWLNTGAAAEDLLARVDWLPDSTSLFVRRLTRTQQKLTLVQVPSNGNQPRTVLEEGDPNWVNLGDDFAILSPERFLMGNERSGHRHLAVFGFDGKLQTQVTTGAWDVTDLNCVNQDWAYFTSTEADPKGRRLYRAKLDGSAKEMLTPEPGSHDLSVAPGCASWMDTYSSLKQPPVINLSGEGRFRGPYARALDYQLTEPEFLTFRSADGAAEFHARLTRPVNFDASRKYPAVVMMYGGPHAQRVRDQWRGADLDQALAAKGFVVWEMDNRGTGNRGHGFEAPLYRRFGKQELADQLEGVRKLVAMGFVDEKKIGVHGWSYGGFMTLMSMLNAPDVFQVGVSGAPVTDWRNYDTIYTERYLGLPSENEEGYRLSSPLHSAANLKGKLLIIHNFEDDNVLFQHTMRMADAFERAGRPFDLQIYPQKTHHVGGGVRGHMYEALVNYFVEHLR